MSKFSRFRSNVFDENMKSYRNLGSGIVSSWVRAEGNRHAKLDSSDLTEFMCAFNPTHTMWLQYHMIFLFHFLHFCSCSSDLEVLVVLNMVDALQRNHGSYYTHLCNHPDCVRRLLQLHILIPLTRSLPSQFYPASLVGLGFAEVPAGYLLWCWCMTELHVLNDKYTRQWQLTMHIN